MPAAGDIWQAGGHLYARLSGITYRLDQQNNGSVINGLRVVTAAGAVTVSAATDNIVVINKTTGAATTVNLPASPAAGLTFVIKDGKGDAASNNITLTPATGTIDGASTSVISTAYGARKVIYNGTQWNVI